MFMVPQLRWWTFMTAPIVGEKLLDLAARGIQIDLVVEHTLQRHPATHRGDDHGRQTLRS